MCKIKCNYALPMLLFSSDKQNNSVLLPFLSIFFFILINAIFMFYLWWSHKLPPHPNCPYNRFDRRKGNRS